jgi:membrane protein
MIVFYGAEFTQEYANKFGQRVRPKPHAMIVEEREVTEDFDDEAKGRPQAEGRYKSA